MVERENWYGSSDTIRTTVTKGWTGSERCHCSFSQWENAFAKINGWVGDLIRKYYIGFLRCRNVSIRRSAADFHIFATSRKLIHTRPGFFLFEKFQGETSPPQKHPTHAPRNGNYGFGVFRDGKTFRLAVFILDSFATSLIPIFSSISNL